MPDVRRREREDFTPLELQNLLTWLEAAYDEPAGSWRFAHWAEIGPGPHYLIEEDGELVAHACVAFGALQAGDLALTAAFVEDVAARADRRREGLATLVMQTLQRDLGAPGQLGVLCTGTPAFYEPLGWERWRGPTSVREPHGAITATPEEDGNVFILRTPQTPTGLALDAPLRRNRRDVDEAW